MELIITQEFLEGFFICFEENNKYHVDFKKFIEKAKDIKLITDFASVEEWYIAASENPLWEILLDIPMMTPQFLPSINSEIEDCSFYSTFPFPYKMFFVNKDGNNCRTLRENFGFEYINVENLEEIWKNYYSEREDFHLPIDSVSRVRFDNWNKLSNYKHPVNSIIIIDKYLFCELNRNGNKQFSYIDNTLKILKNLLINVENKIDTQILIITDKRNINIDDISQPSNNNRKMDFIKGKIENFISMDFPLLKFDLSIIHYDKHIHSTDSEHDRGVYTNYFYFEIGTGLNIINCSNQIINRSKISFYFPFRSEHKDITFSGLNSLFVYLQDVDNMLSNGVVVDRNSYVSGNTNNRLIRGL